MKKKDEINKLIFTAIEDLQNLEVLGVMKNEIHSLPSGIGRLKKLVEMNVDSNHLTGFPRELCNLQCLKELSASNNNLITLPLGKSTSFSYIKM